MKSLLVLVGLSEWFFLAFNEAVSRNWESWRRTVAKISTWWQRTSYLKIQALYLIHVTLYYLLLIIIIIIIGHSPTEIVDSNPTGGMDVCLFWVLCVFR
jgi:hypothetical protein